MTLAVVGVYNDVEGAGIGLVWLNKSEEAPSVFQYLASALKED